MKKIIRTIFPAGTFFLCVYFCLSCSNQTSMQYICHRTEEFNFCEITNGQNEDSPLIILQHGLEGTKEDMNSWAKHLARSGYTVVILDAAGHGDNAWECALDLPEIIKITSDWYDEILAYYREKGTPKEDNFAITGISMGGMIALYYGAYGKNTPKCIISLYSSYNWSALVQTDAIYLKMENGNCLPITNTSEQQEICKKLKEYSPINGADQLLQIPILMINGDCDPIMSVPDNDVLKEAVTGQFLLPEIIIREGQGHQLAEGDSTESLKFLVHYITVN